MRIECGEKEDGIFTEVKYNGVAHEKHKMKSPGEIMSAEIFRRV